MQSHNVVLTSKLFSIKHTWKLWMLNGDSSSCPNNASKHDDAKCHDMIIIYENKCRMAYKTWVKEKAIKTSNLNANANDQCR